MSEKPQRVVHVIGPDVSIGRLETARMLAAAGAAGDDLVVLVGEARQMVDWPGAMHVTAPFDVPFLGPRRMRRAIGCRRHAIEYDGPALVHVWSAQALQWVLAGSVGPPWPTWATKNPASRADQSRLRTATNQSARDLADGASALALLIDVETPAAVLELPAHVLTTAAFICPTSRAQACLAARGVPAERRWLIRDAVDLDAIESAPRADLRQALGIAADQTAIVVLPPLTRAAGAEYAVWAGLLLEKVRPDVRLVVPGRAVENRHIHYLVRSCRHEHVVRFAEGWPLAGLAAVADLAVYVPIGDAPLGSIAWVMAAGRPIVASCVPGIADLLENNQTAWLCRPRDPHDAARRMLHALEQAESSVRLAAAARQAAAPLFARPAVLEQYERAYATLAAGGVFLRTS